MTHSCCPVCQEYYDFDPTQELPKAHLLRIHQTKYYYAVCPKCEFVLKFLELNKKEIPSYEDVRRCRKAPVTATS